MFLLVVSLVVVLPLIELYGIVQVGHQVGILPTVALLIAISAVGTSLVKREGLRVYKDFTSAIQRGEEPSKQIVHGVCILAAGVFLLAPGFISDVLAILLLLPPTRVLATKLVLRKSRSRITVIRATHSGPIVETKGTLASSFDVIDVDPLEGENNK
ncbi:MAG: FxsA family protein [Actinomycetota bacterium]